MRTWMRWGLFSWQRTDAGVMLMLLQLDRDAARDEWPPWKTRRKL
jgi:hypothetical protein